MTEEEMIAQYYDLRDAFYSFAKMVQMYYTETAQKFLDDGNWEEAAKLCYRCPDQSTSLEIYEMVQDWVDKSRNSL